MIETWKKETPMNGPEIMFIKRSRDLILKEGAFEAYATRTESGIGEASTSKLRQRDTTPRIMWMASGVICLRTCMPL